MAKLRRRHLDDLQAKLENLSDRIVEVRNAVAREAEIRVMTTRQEPQLADFERVAALLTGVRVALERMGGTTLPAFREDVQALRHDISRLGTDLAGYAADQAKTANFIEALHIKLSLDNPKPAIKLPERRGRGRRDKAALDEVQQLGLMDQWRDQLDQDVAEAEAKPKRRGRPRKDTSQKLMDEPAQEVMEE